MGKILKAIGEILFPDDIKCIACSSELFKKTKYGLCNKCKPSINDKYCSYCGRGLDNMAKLCNNCMDYGKQNFDKALSSLNLTEPERQIIYKFKYGGEKFLAGYMAEFMLDAYYENMLTPDIITYVPMHEKRERKRGYNQAKLLAQVIADNTKVKLENTLDKTVYMDSNLAKMSGTERKNAIKDSFKIRDMCGIVDKNVLIIDDILTTGSTASECARVLKQAKAKSVTVLTFASVPIKPDLG